MSGTIIMLVLSSKHKLGSISATCWGRFLSLCCSSFSGFGRWWPNWGRTVWPLCQRWQGLKKTMCKPLSLINFCIRHGRVMEKKPKNSFPLLAIISVPTMSSGGFKKTFYWGFSNYAKFKAFLRSGDQKLFLLFA